MINNKHIGFKVQKTKQQYNINTGIKLSLIMNLNYYYLLKYLL